MGVLERNCERDAEYDRQRRMRAVPVARRCH
jgi:hypothetical protein